MNSAVAPAPARRLTRREARIARAFLRHEKAKERAGALYSRVDFAEKALVALVKKAGRKLDEFTWAVRITPEGKHLLVTDQYAEAQAEFEKDGTGKVWAHAAARPFKFSTKNLE